METPPALTRQNRGPIRGPDRTEILRQTAPRCPCARGPSVPCRDADAYPRAYAQTRQVLQCIRAFHGPGSTRVLAADELGAGRLLLMGADAAEADRFVDETLRNMLADTGASLERLLLGLSIATAATLIIGLVLGLLPVIRAGLGPLIAAISVVPPIALLPILFIVMGLGEASKVALIVVGITPFMIRDLASHVAAIPEEQMVKAQSLGGSTWQIGLRVALPQAMPRLIKCLRLSLGPAWVFLISAEAIASDVGLGYRIFLVRRYLAMDVIIPYVIWISLLAVATDLTLLWISKRFYPWAHAAREA